MRIVSEERGYTLMELLVATTMFIIVLGATLAPLNGFWRTTKQNERQNVSQDGARQTIDKLATDLRSVAGQSQLIEKAQPNDLVFKVADPLVNPSGSNADNVKRVRYCLYGTTLVRQEQSWSSALPPALPSTSACPDAAPWTSSTMCSTSCQTYTTVATDVVNASTPCGGASSPGSCPIFTYDTSTLTNIKTVSIDLIVDATPGVRPTATELKTSVTLRNQDRIPVSTFIAFPTGSLHVSLDGSASYDPEGTGLTYRWCLVSSCSAGAAIGTTPLLDYVAPGAGSRTFYLDVTDAGGLMTESTQTVTVT